MQQPQYMVQQPFVQPVMQQPLIGQAYSWDQGLCDCFNDCESCLIGCCCSSCSIGWSLEQVFPDSNCILWSCLGVVAEGAGCCCLISMMARGKFGRNYNLPVDDGCGECCVGTFCYPCVACQILHETKLRMSRGDFGQARMAAPMMYAQQPQMVYAPATQPPPGYQQPPMAYAQQQPPMAYAQQQPVDQKPAY